MEVNDKGIHTAYNDSACTCCSYVVIKPMKDTIKILSDMTKKDAERCLVFA